MAKEIPEEKFNYNRFPGAHVVQLTDVVKVGEKSFALVEDFKEAFDVVEVEHRYSEIFAKYDYIVGDWGHEQLRLRGFYDVTQRHAFPEEKIDHLADYLQEYCNYGCPYFVLQRLRQPEETDADEERQLEAKESRQNKPTDRNKKRKDSGKKRNNSQNNNNQKKSQHPERKKTSTPHKNRNNKGKRQTFTMRERTK